MYFNNQIFLIKYSNFLGYWYSRGVTMNLLRYSLYCFKNNSELKWLGNLCETKDFVCLYVLYTLIIYIFPLKGIFEYPKLYSDIPDYEYSLNKWVDSWVIHNGGWISYSTALRQHHVQLLWYMLASVTWINFAMFSYCLKLWLLVDFLWCISTYWTTVLRSTYLHTNISVSARILTYMVT